MDHRFPPLRANLRVCASCEWIFYLPDNNDPSCPKCHFGSYGANYAYGARAYYYVKSQKPWYEKKMGDCSTKLNREIEETKRTLCSGDIL